MNRVIKFRGKAISTGIWQFGGVTTDRKCIIGKPIVGKPRKMYKVDPDTVGEFTGFKDANNKEIFEGDIIQNYANYDGEVYSIHMYEGLWSGLVPGGSMEKYTDFSSLNWLLANGEFKIIGNVYENPELLGAFMYEQSCWDYL